MGFQVAAAVLKRYEIFDRQSYSNCLAQVRKSAVTVLH